MIIDMEPTISHQIVDGIRYLYSHKMIFVYAFIILFMLGMLIIMF